MLFGCTVKGFALRSHYAITRYGDGADGAASGGDAS